MFLWRAVCWRAAFGHVGSAYRHHMIRGVFGVVKGGFSGIRRRMQDGGIPAYAGMTGWGVGMGGDTMGWRAGYDVMGAGYGGVALSSLGVRVFTPAGPWAEVRIGWPRVGLRGLRSLCAEPSPVYWRRRPYPYAHGPMRANGL